MPRKNRRKGAKGDRGPLVVGRGVPLSELRQSKPPIIRRDPPPPPRKDGRTR
jgi:hypothetical protein